MFGIFYMAANAIAYIVSGTKTVLDDNYHKQRAIEEEKKDKVKTHTYTDHRGSTRDITTNQLRYFGKDYTTGDTWLEDVHGRKIRNLSEEKRNIEFQEQIQKQSGRRAVKYDDWTRQNSKISGDHMFKLTGEIYKDIYNGDLYIEKNYIKWDKETLYEYRIGKPFYRASFYMRVSDGMLVCLNDREQPEKCEELLAEVPSTEEVEKFISFFNQKQREGGWKNAEQRERGSKFFQEKYYPDYYLDKH